jgi:hypothetical protein
VIVAVMRVHDVHPLPRHEGAKTSRVSHDGERARLDVEMEAFHRLHARLAGLDLEAVAAGEGEERPMSPRAQGKDETGHRLGAARPPAVGYKVKDGERSRPHARFLERPARTSS